MSSALEISTCGKIGHLLSTQFYCQLRKVTILLCQIPIVYDVNDYEVDLTINHGQSSTVLHCKSNQYEHWTKLNPSSGLKY